MKNQFNNTNSPLFRRRGRRKRKTNHEVSAGDCEDDGAAIEIAGSIRRRRPNVGDIDLVAIPKLEVRKSGLFAEELQKPRDSRLVAELCGTPGAKVIQRGDKTVSVQLPLPEGLRTEVPAAAFVEGIRVDLYLATAETWATTLLIRTGSAAHNIFLCTRARELGGRLHASGEGLELPGPHDDLNQKAGPMVKMRPEDEREIFNALNLIPNFGGARHDGIEPEQRECLDTGKPIWMR